MFLKPGVWWIIVVTIFLPAAFLFSGKVYRCTDEKGTVHFTDDASKIPEEHFEQAERIQVLGRMLKETERTGKPEGKSDRAKNYLEDLDKRIGVKRRMGKRVSELEEELRLS